MKSSTLRKISYLYLILPIIVFYLGYIKLFISIPLAIGLLFLFKRLVQAKKIKEESTFLPKKYIVILGIVITIICFFAGMGGNFYQSNDYHWRNAIFRDLINFDWPVYYENIDASLCYYIGHWIIPAIVAKPFLLISSNVAWQIGNIMLLLWSSFGVLLAMLWLIYLLQIKKAKYVLFAVAAFLLFSGMDFVGADFFNRKVIAGKHLEWWTPGVQFSSMITQLFWVFNQAIVPWIITLMFLKEDSPKNYLALGLLCLPYGPLPFCGIVFLFVGKGITFFIKAIKNRKVAVFFKDVFSAQNILALILIFPVYLLYYSNNSATTGGGFRLATEFLNYTSLKNIFVFWLLEIGIIYIILFWKNRKNVLFHLSFLGLLFCPFFKIGYSADFCMRASIPLLVVCAYYVINTLYQYFNKKKKKTFTTVTMTILVEILMIGAITPFFEFYRAFYTIKTTHKINAVADNIKTFSDKDPSELQNFITVNPKENSLFFKYLCK